MRPCHGRKKKDWIYSEIVRQLRSTGVTGIHGEEDAELWIHIDDVAVCKNELLSLLSFARQNDGYLLRRYRQNSKFDAVELVKAAPRS